MGHDRGRLCGAVGRGWAAARFRGDAVSTVVVDQTDPAGEEASFTSRNLLAYVPGVLLLIAIGLLGKYAQLWWNSLAHHEHWTVPDIEYVLWAIVIGLVATNAIGLHRIFRAGVQTYEFWLKIGIVTLGVRFLAVSAIATAGWLSKGQSANVANVSRWAFLLTFAGVGLNANIRELVRTGRRPLVVAIIGLVVVAAVSLGLVLLTSRGLHWGVGAG
jgi:uncharacterized membrane protein YadS